MLSFVSRMEYLAISNEWHVAPPMLLYRLVQNTLLCPDHFIHQSYMRLIQDSYLAGVAGRFMNVLILNNI